MRISTFFAEDGTPKTGLSATIDIYKVSDQSKVVNAAAMTEVGGGFYFYDFATHDSDEDYTVICDSVTLTGRERYAVCAIEKYNQGVIENSLEEKEVLRLLLARAAGKASGGGGSSIKFRDQADTKDRITLTVNSYGNRSAVSVDGS